MKDLGYYNGKIGPIEEMTIPMNDRVCWFGDGVYDAGPCRNYHIFAAEEHIDRFFSSAAQLDIRIPLSKSGLRALLEDLVKKLDTGDIFVYYQVTRGTAMRAHDYDPAAEGNLWVMLRPAVQRDLNQPIQLLSVEDTRYFHCNIKTLNLIPNVMASQKARMAGCQEVVFYRPGGRVTECAHSNVHILRDGALWTAPADELILAGIARAHLIRLCHGLGIPVHEEPFTLDELYEADEIAVTSSSKLVCFADRVDGRSVGGRQPEMRQAILQGLLKEYLDATGGSTA